MKQSPYDAQRREHLPTQKERPCLIDCSDFLMLAKYAEFPDGSASYAMIEALKHLYRQDKEFEAWLSAQQAKNQQPISKGDSVQPESK